MLGNSRKMPRIVVRNSSCQSINRSIIRRSVNPTINQSTNHTRVDSECITILGRTRLFICCKIAVEQCVNTSFGRPKPPILPCIRIRKQMNRNNFILSSGLPGYGGFYSLNPHHELTCHFSVESFAEVK